eukprot:1227655-Pyramimonas_sp.AAC.1
MTRRTRLGGGGGAGGGVQVGGGGWRASRARQLSAQAAGRHIAFLHQVYERCPREHLLLARDGLGPR